MEQKNIAVIIEHKAGKLHSSAGELLGEGRRLANSIKGQLHGVLVGQGMVELAPQCIALGADKVFVVDEAPLKEYMPTPYVKAIVEVLQQISPAVVLLGATLQGREIAPAISVRLGTGLTADCTKLSFNKEGLLVMTRPTLGGNLLAEIICPNTLPQMATVRPGVFDKPEENPQRVGQIEMISFPIKESDCPYEILETVPETIDHKDIVDEDVLVVGGKGIPSEEMYRSLYDLAELLGAGVGVTRGLVENHWAPYTQQIGQTGRTVRPKFYLGFGVSGAIQHITGMEFADFILSVNNDKDAPIFKFSHGGIVCDVKPLIPKLIERLKEIK
ncbi:MAG: electron transfer flavoprotein subunit alpha/FixB family protein [Brevinema sp.]